MTEHLSLVMKENSAVVEAFPGTAGWEMYITKGFQSPSRLHYMNNLHFEAGDLQVMGVTHNDLLLQIRFFVITMLKSFSYKWDHPQIISRDELEPN